MSAGAVFFDLHRSINAKASKIANPGVASASKSG